MRVSYVKDGIAVTVGVAVFDTAAQATKVKGQVNTKKDIIRSLSGKGVKDFCTSSVCLSTSNSYGRYAYFTITGFTSGKDMTDKDTAAFQVSDELEEFTFHQILRRGQAQASAAANE
ncbi:Tat pathway signal sequence domain protein OS=Streptomyces chartreusis OX=1969 GN=CP983_17240 PE=4 SV=1 [Streptomyces chartreusis]